MKRKQTLLIASLIIIFFCGAVYFLWLFFQTPAVGVIRPGVVPKKEDAFDQSTETKHFAGTYFSFSYPGKYQEVSHTFPETGPVKETLLLSASDVEGKKIAITAEKRDTDTFDASPSFQMRRNDFKTYGRSSLKWQDLDGVLFTKNSQVFEQTVFFRKNNFILSISTTSPFSLETLRGDLENILESLEWKSIFVSVALTKGHFPAIISK